MAHTYSRLFYHVVFSTKDRRPHLTPEIRDRVHAYLGGIIKELGGAPLAIGGTGDHVHLLIETHPATALSDLVRMLKANSSKWIHETFPDQSLFAWQLGYSAFTVSESVKQQVALYIRNQESHHAGRSFDDELEAFLNRHGLSLDPRDAAG